MEKNLRQSRRGFMLLDTVAGVLLLLVTILLLTGVTTRGRVAARKLAADRAATRLAETALMQGAADARPHPLQGVDIRLLDGPAPATYVWATATAVVEGRRATVTGLVHRPAATTEATR